MAQVLPQDLLDYLYCCPDGATILSIACDGTNQSVFGIDDGTASVVVLTGSAPYTYLWSNNETTALITDLAPGIYTVTVTDAHAHVRECYYEVLAQESSDIPKYLFKDVLPSPTNISELETLYPGITQDSSTIESDFGIGTPTIHALSIVYGNAGDFLTETIFVDITSSTTFWNDIIGWLFLNNFYDITYDVGLDMWLINDPANFTYIEVVNPCTSYRLTATGFLSHTYSYTGCDGTQSGLLVLADNEVITICAIEDPIITGITVENLGPC